MNLRYDIIKGKFKPIIRVDGVRYLFDTWATVPVWCAGLERFVGNIQMPKCSHLNIS